MPVLGLIINPVAGMGGSVGLKGTDGKADEAQKRGAVPHAQDRAATALAPLKDLPDLTFLTCSGEMGEDVLRQCGISRYRIAYTAKGKSTADDTKNAVRAVVAEGADLILFCGGDGTARDVFAAAGRDVPVLGIPAGVKMYSAVFAVDPASAAGILSGPYTITDGDVVDVDEEAYRAGTLATRLYGIARVAARAGMTQPAKQVFEEADEERAKDEIARFMAEVMLPDTLYILGAGTTTEAIARRLGMPKALLGVDAALNGNIIAADADEKTLLSLTGKYPGARIIVSPIGAQGFILGRGSQQISPAVVRRVGTDRVIVVATPHKLRETPALYVDSGDPEIDAGFGPSVLVISGYRIAQRKKIHRAEEQ
ncbi:ATP-NAD kinase family protein [Methanoregula sp. UBA64]|jgi:predicted polyphosphate/ATP-dependent NAD kinase|uniref:ATP-NAD kinase family protein n=1 Tax=Methanoregula sp. UBA64 TaxID=1915554 RepID=UPI0025F25283|nr:ATP-NAD kinase family protein [Methanoregula sp. UBA64]